MSDKELIKQEIKRRIVQAEEFAERAEGANDEPSKLSWDFVATQNKSLLQFIESLQEEPVSEDLEEEIENYIKDSLAIKFPTTDKEQIKADIRYIARHFAEWQKQQMMKDAIGGDVVCQIGSAEIAPTDMRYKVVSDRVYIPNVKLGDRVKIIIVKEE